MAAQAFCNMFKLDFRQISGIGDIGCEMWNSTKCHLCRPSISHLSPVDLGSRIWSQEISRDVALSQSNHTLQIWASVNVPWRYTVQWQKDRKSVQQRHSWNISAFGIARIQAFELINQSNDCCQGLLLSCNQTYYALGPRTTKQAPNPSNFISTTF